MSRRTLQSLTINQIRESLSEKIPVESAVALVRTVPHTDSWVGDKVLLILEIADENSELAGSEQEKREARIILVRKLLVELIGDLSYHTIQQISVKVIRFYARSKVHIEGLDTNDRKILLAFLRKAWAWEIRRKLWPSDATEQAEGSNQIVKSLLFCGDFDFVRRLSIVSAVPVLWGYLEELADFQNNDVLRIIGRLNWRNWHRLDKIGIAPWAIPADIAELLRAEKEDIELDIGWIQMNCANFLWHSSFEMRNTADLLVLFTQMVGRLVWASAS